MNRKPNKNQNLRLRLGRGKRLRKTQTAMGGFIFVMGGFVRWELCRMSKQKTNLLGLIDEPIYQVYY